MYIFAGKTVQVIAFLAALYERYGVTGPHLVVLPLSVMTSWKGDLKKFTTENAFDVYIHHGEKISRQEAFEQWYHALKKRRKRSLSTAAAAHNSSNSNCYHKGVDQNKNSDDSEERVSIVLTTYEVAMKDEHLLRRLNKGLVKWEYLVVKSLDFLGCDMANKTTLFYAICLCYGCLFIFFLLHDIDRWMKHID